MAGYLTRQRASDGERKVIELIVIVNKLSKMLSWTPPARPNPKALAAWPSGETPPGKATGFSLTAPAPVSHIRLNFLIELAPYLGHRKGSR